MRLEYKDRFVSARAKAGVLGDLADAEYFPGLVSRQGSL